MISKMGIPSDKYQEKLKNVLDGASTSSLLGRFQVFIIGAFSFFLNKLARQMTSIGRLDCQRLISHEWKMPYVLAWSTLFGI